MPIQDYHRRWLNQYVWDADERNLLQRARAQIMDQIPDRFPTATAVYLLGDLAGHYYDEDSSLDILVALSEEDIEAVTDELEFLSNRTLLPSEHPIQFYLISNSYDPLVVASKFGPLYDIMTGVWYGRRVQGLTELARPEAILQRIAWELFKAKKSLDLFPVYWTSVFAAFDELDEDEQQEIVDTLLYRINRFERSLRKNLKHIGDKSIWKAVDAFEEELIKTEDEELPHSTDLPRAIVYTVLNKFRYEDIKDRLEEMMEKEAKRREVEESMKNLPIEAAVKRTAADVGTELLKRLTNIFNIIYLATGGLQNSVDTTIKLFGYILDNSRFIQTNSRRRKIALALYHKYYRGV